MVVIIVDPPGVPRIKKGESSRFVTIVGVIELNIRFPDAIEFASLPISPYIFGWPGLIEKSSISLFNKNPLLSTVIPLPNHPFREVVKLTEFPYLSIIDKCVVSVDSSSITIRSLNISTDSVAILSTIVQNKLSAYYCDINCSTGTFTYD